MPRRVLSGRWCVCLCRSVAQVPAFLQVPAGFADFEAALFACAFAPPASRFKPGDDSCIAGYFFCAEHFRQLGGASPLPSLEQRREPLNKNRIRRQPPLGERANDRETACGDKTAFSYRG